MKMGKVNLITVMFFVVFAANTVWADTPHSSESEIVTIIANENLFLAEVPGHDPFKPVIGKRIAIIKIEKPTKLKEKEQSKTNSVAVEPLQVNVTGICGNDQIRQALIKLGNLEYTLVAGDMVEGKFSVVEVKPEEVVLYSVKESKRKVFKLSSAK